MHRFRFFFPLVPPTVDNSFRRFVVGDLALVVMLLTHVDVFVNVVFDHVLLVFVLLVVGP